MKRTSSIVLFVVCAALFGCDSTGGKQPLSSPAVEGDRIVFPQGSAQLSAIVSEPVKFAGVSSVRLPGRLAWDEDRTVRLFPAFAGRVAKIFAKPGDVVKKGQILAQLASPEFGQAQADARKAASDFALAEKNLARLRELAAGGVAPQKELDAAEAEYSRAQAEFARAAGRVRLYGSADGTIDQSFALRSPIAGAVVERNINPGQELRPDLMLANTPAMFVVTDPSQLWVFLDATEKDLSRLKRGETVKLHIQAHPEQTFDAVIDNIADFVDPQARTIKVRGSVANPDHKLKGEMFVSAELAAAPLSAVVAPAKAVFLQGSRNFVFVEEGPGRYARVPIRIGPEEGGGIPVVEGLKEGQRVVVDGNLFLQQLLQSKAVS